MQENRKNDYFIKFEKKQSTSVQLQSDLEYAFLGSFLWGNMSPLYQFHIHLGL